MKNIFNSGELYSKAQQVIAVESRGGCVRKDTYNTIMQMHAS